MADLATALGDVTTMCATSEDISRAAEISKRIRGYSDERHYSAFRRILEHTAIRKLLVVGVFFGRDISFFLDIARRLGSPLSIVGVDRFTDEACDDWPEEKRGMTWEAAGFGEPPSLEAAQANIAPFGSAKLIKSLDHAFFEECREKFDAIYLDTAHDYETVRRQILRARELVNPGGYLFGDDYSDQGTWGVKRAVTELAPQHLVLFDWIWIAPISAFFGTASS